MQIAEALRLLRTRQGLTQTAASRVEGAPDFRTISHWETRRKYPSLKLLGTYLEGMGFDFHDLQEALDQADGQAPKRVRERLAGLQQLFATLEQRVCDLEAALHLDPLPKEATDEHPE